MTIPDAYNCEGEVLEKGQMHIHNRHGQTARYLLVDPLRFNLDVSLGPVLAPSQSVCFNPDLDRPVEFDLDALIVLHRNVSPRAHIETAYGTPTSTNYSLDKDWHLDLHNTLVPAIILVSLVIQHLRDDLEDPPPRCDFELVMQ